MVHTTSKDRRRRRDKQRYEAEKARKRRRDERLAEKARSDGFNSGIWTELIKSECARVEVIRKDGTKSILLRNVVEVFPYMRKYLWTHSLGLITSEFQSEKGMCLSTNTPCGNKPRLNLDYNMVPRNYYGRIDTSREADEDNIPLYSYAVATGAVSVGIPKR